MSKFHANHIDLPYSVVTKVKNAVKGKIKEVLLSDRHKKISYHFQVKAKYNLKIALSSEPIIILRNFVEFILSHEVLTAARKFKKSRTIMYHGLLDFLRKWFFL